MRRALILAFVVVFAAVLLGATAFREQVANAAAILNVFVANDPAHPVPVALGSSQNAVTSADMTQVLFADYVDGTGGGIHQTPTFDVLAYKQVGLYVTVSGLCASVDFEVNMGVADGAYFVDSFTVPGCGQERKLYDLPGGYLRVNYAGGTEDTVVGISVFGRRN
jgi:hypothetical protein